MPGRHGHRWPLPRTFPDHNLPQKLLQPGSLSGPVSAAGPSLWSRSAVREQESPGLSGVPSRWGAAYACRRLLTVSSRGARRWRPRQVRRRWCSGPSSQGPGGLLCRKGQPVSSWASHPGSMQAGAPLGPRPGDPTAPPSACLSSSSFPVWELSLDSQPEEDVGCSRTLAGGPGEPFGGQLCGPKVPVAARGRLALQSPTQAQKPSAYPPRLSGKRQREPRLGQASHSGV